MKIPVIIILTYLFTGLPDNPIIIRHDISDEKYIAFAEELPVTSAIVKYNSTDLAGTLIAPQWVLSAAHVAETIKADHKLILGEDSIGVEKIIIHPGWQENNRPDIAIIKLNKKVSDIEPVELYRQTDEAGKEVIVAGIGDFGTGLTGPEGQAGTMRAATNRVDNASEVYLSWEFDDPEGEKVTRLEGISGPGDSGGPAFIKIDNKYYIAGISSAQSTQATDGKEGLYGVIEYYVRVSAFVEWIESEISGD